MSPVRCEAAEQPVEAAPAAEAPAAVVEEVVAPVSDLSANGPRGGWAYTKFQRGSPFKVGNYTSWQLYQLGSAWDRTAPFAWLYGSPKLTYPVQAVTPPHSRPW